MLEKNILQIPNNWKSIVFWMDYPENFEITEQMKQQSSYYFRSKSVLFVIVYFWDHATNQSVLATLVSPLTSEKATSRFAHPQQFQHCLFHAWYVPLFGTSN